MLLRCHHPACIDTSTLYDERKYVPIVIYHVWNYSSQHYSYHNCMYIRPVTICNGIQNTWYARIQHNGHSKGKLKNVSCEYDRGNGWNSTLQAAWYIRHVCIIWFLWTKRTYDMIINAQFYTKYRSRVFSVLSFFMKDIGRWLPWMLPGSTGRFSITILCTDTI